VSPEKNKEKREEILCFFLFHPKGNAPFCRCQMDREYLFKVDTRKKDEKKRERIKRERERLLLANGA
jgi:hypothetical protein